MSAVAFDTLKFVDTLEQARLLREQARAIAAAVRESHDTADLVTKKDLDIALAPVHGEFKLQRALMGVVLGGIIAQKLRPQGRSSSIRPCAPP